MIVFKQSSIHWFFLLTDFSARGGSKAGSGNLFIDF